MTKNDFELLKKSNDPSNTVLHADNLESKFEDKFTIRHIKDNAEVRVFFNPENTTAKEIVSSLNNHYALVEALKDFVNGIDIIVDGMKEGETLNCYKSLQNSLTYKNAKELLNNINESK